MSACAMTLQALLIIDFGSIHQVGWDDRVNRAGSDRLCGCWAAGSSDPGGGVISAASEKEQAERKKRRRKKKNKSNEFRHENSQKYG